MKILATIAGFLMALSCSLRPQIPIVIDDPAEALVRADSARIIEVSEDREKASEYRIYLSNFPRPDILGLSIGQRRIYINHTLARLAMRNRWHRWLLRQTLAHEIAHESTGHANRNTGVFFNGSDAGRALVQTDVGLPSHVRFLNYSYESELAADAKGLDYWRRLNWDCRIWVAILEAFRRDNYTGDVFHPTEQRLHQARKDCRPSAIANSTAALSPATRAP